MTQAFGDKLKQFRESLGISGYRLAKDAGLAYSNLHHIESGKRPPTDEVLSKIAPILGISFDELKAWANVDKLGAEELSAIRKYAPEALGLQVLDGGLDVPDDIEDEPDDWEREVLIRTGAATAHDYSSQSDFWYLPKHERRAILENLDEIWRENEELMKKMRKRG